MPTLRWIATKTKGIDKQDEATCSRNTLRTNQVPDAINGRARLTLAAEVHDPRRQVASFTGKYAASRR